MADNQKVRVVFEFDRKPDRIEVEDYYILFLLGTSSHDRDEVEKAWEVMTSEDVILKSDSFASLGVTPQEMLAMFVAGAVVTVEDQVKAM